MTAEVVSATDADVPRLSRVLSAAFANDSVCDWLFDGMQDHHNPKFFAVFLAAALRAGRVEQTADGTGVAVWFDATALLSAFADTELDEALEKAVGPCLPRWKAFDVATIAAHTSDPHWYLAFLGVIPAHWGRGHGGELLRHAASWQAGAAAYLEAPSRRHVGFYGARGWERGEAIVVPNGPVLYAMHRPAL